MMGTTELNRFSASTAFPVAASIVFLLIFIVVWATTPLIGDLGPRINLPFAHFASTYPGSERDLIIYMPSDRRIIVSHMISSPTDLPKMLREIHDRTPDRTVVVLADRSLPYGEIRNVLGWSRNAGFSEFWLLTFTGNRLKLLMREDA